MKWFDSMLCRTQAGCVQCRGAESYRRYLFSTGAVPEVEFACPLGKPITADIVRRSRPNGGAGTELKRLLAGFGIEATTRCKCDAMASNMDGHPPEWSEEHRAEIVAVMNEEAARRKLPFSVFLAGRLLAVAIRRAKKNLQKEV